MDFAPVVRKEPYYKHFISQVNECDVFSLLQDYSDVFALGNK